MGEFDIIKIFCINYLECMKNERKTVPFTLFISKIFGTVHNYKKYYFFWIINSTKFNNIINIGKNIIDNNIIKSLFFNFNFW